MLWYNAIDWQRMVSRPKIPRICGIYIQSYSKFNISSVGKIAKSQQKEKKEIFRLVLGEGLIFLLQMCAEKSLAVCHPLRYKWKVPSSSSRGPDNTSWCIPSSYTSTFPTLLFPKARFHYRMSKTTTAYIKDLDTTKESPHSKGLSRFRKHIRDIQMKWGPLMAAKEDVFDEYNFPPGRYAGQGCIKGTL